jgi:hypothetical protein
MEVAAAREYKGCSASLSIHRHHRKLPRTGGASSFDGSSRRTIFGLLVEDTGRYRPQPTITRMVWCEGQTAKRLTTRTSWDLPQTVIPRS